MNKKRADLATLMDGTVANKWNWHYALIRPEGRGVTRKQALTGKVIADCSAGAGLLAHLAKIPNILQTGNFNGCGNTGTAFQHLGAKGFHVRNISDLQVGDVIIYGPSYATHHMVMVRRPGKDPLVWSNGWEGAPEFISASTMARHQPSPATYFRIMPADPEPKPAPKVDEYWNWLQWYLGEGKYKGHQRDPDLRDNKNWPIPISKEWWEREKDFIEARRELYS